MYISLYRPAFSICQAPCEAEAQCASLVKAGKVYATGTEDMDALTFGSSVLLRHLTFSEARLAMPIISACRSGDAKISH